MKTLARTLGARTPRARSAAAGIVGLVLAGVAYSYTTSAAPPAKSADQRRTFYLTRTLHNGDTALTACAAGYHMASTWELLDVSNLRYERSLGRVAADAGFGPPQYVPDLDTGEDLSILTVGWVRTGAPAVVEDIRGAANCNVWTSASDSHWGSFAALFLDGSNPRLGIGYYPCFVPPLPTGVIGVWCVQD